ncbi:hypothetical protein [Prosthecobacter sp.]|uniref:hypothetical protein n=1 Tax=Prosthecobacter sp. TaxID=1965333 RepID=UPI001D2250C0|nr:hypothetical protein [Prosthecobacter sp.]MCB1275248.1 hypothetical protein [Prosthecobacter sp.]
MNTSLLKIAALSALLTSSASAASYVVNLTGSTAFRSSTHSAILANLTSPTYAYTDKASNGLNKAKFVIFKGTIGADDYTIRCSWSGSVEGVVDTGSQNSIAALPTTQSTATAPGTALVNSNENTFATDTMIPDGGMSDVFQSSTSETGALTDKIVAVVPFVFIANNGTVGVTNMTPQIFRTVYGPGGAPLSILTGNPADNATYVFGVGRDIGSGTRATTMAETGYGIFTAPAQYTVTVGTSTWSAADLVSQSATSGYTSGSTMATDLAKASSDGSVCVGYVGVADKNVNNVELTYCGATYSAANVYNGNYTFWGYEHLFTPSRVSTATTGDDLARKNFFNSMAATLASAPGAAGLNPALMQVHRDGDGATVLEGPLP